MKEGTIKETLYEVACFLCGRACQVRLCRNGNPYFVCLSCGIRVFVNGPSGKERLAQISWEKEETSDV